MEQENVTQKSRHELQGLADQVGEFIGYWGFKKVHGRIWTHLFLSEQPLDAAQIIERLGISKALVSISLKDLSEYHVISEVGRSARGTTLYTANPQIAEVILNVLRQREKQMLAKIQLAHRGLKELPELARAAAGVSDTRLAQIEEMIDFAVQSLDQMLGLKMIDLGPLQTFGSSTT